MPNAFTPQLNACKYNFSQTSTSADVTEHQPSTPLQKVATDIRTQNFEHQKPIAMNEKEKQSQPFPIKGDMTEEELLDYYRRNTP